MPLRPPVAALAAATLTLAALTTTPTLAAASTTTGAEPQVPLTGRTTLTLLGKGYGHGRGMSQFGAAGAAAAGRTWSQITAFYYPGATPTQATTASLRVGLTDTLGAGLRVVAAPGLVATDGTTTRTLPTSDTTDGVTSPVVRWEVQPLAAAPGTMPGATCTALWFVTATGRRAPLAASSGSWSISSTTGTVRTATAGGTPGPGYLGSLAGIRTGTTIAPVLTTSLESYVRMVVPNEVYTSWPGQALAAQAVAARTYAVSYLRSHTPTAATGDICSSTRCQVLGGIQTETASTRTAVAATAGIVLTSGGKPINAEFSSSNGGWTVDGGAPYLPAQADPYDRNPLNSGGSWRTDVPVSRLAAAYPGLGPLTGLQVLARDGHGELGGRVLSVRITGTLGTRTVTGDSLRSALGLRSTLVSLAATPTRTTPLAAGALLATNAAGAVTGPTGPARPTATATPRLLTAVGEWDDVAGTDALGLDATGHLVLVSGVGTATATTRVVAAGLGDVTGLSAITDLNGDRQRDLLVRRGNGLLQRLTADGRGGVLPGATTVGSGWTGIPAFFAADLTGDGVDELVAVLGDGTVVAYPGARDVFGARRAVGRLTGYRSITSHGDRTGDGRADLVALDAAGVAWLVPTTAAGTLGTPTRLAAPTGATHLL